MSKLSRREFLRSGLVASLSLLGRRRERNVPLVTALWSGGLTPHSIRVNARLTDDSGSVRAIADTSPAFGNPVASPIQTAHLATNNRMVSLHIQGLQPDKDYYYTIEADGMIDAAAVGRFRTPVEGAFSFTLAFGSCAATGSNHPVFDTIRGHAPLFFLHMGDLHYEDIGTDDRDRFRQAYDRVLAQPRQAALFRDVPLAYIWDDHDYGPNDSDATAPGRRAARLTYQEYVPHYPLVAGSGDVPIYQAFTIGRVRFILTDTRSERSPKPMPDTAVKTMLGVDQKAWFKQELLSAKDLFPVIVWVSTSPWLADLPRSGTDNWAGYGTERRELADFITANEIPGLIMLSGDVHMIAIDDGRHNRYSTGGTRGFPIMQAAPFDRINSSSLPDNVYSEGQYPGHQQFGLMTVVDDGGPVVRVLWRGQTAAGDVLVEHEMKVPPGARLSVSPSSLTFAALEGRPQQQTLVLTIANPGVEPLHWTAAADPIAEWLSLDPVEGSVMPEAEAELTVAIDAGGLLPGTYHTLLRIDGGAATYSPQSVEVTLVVAAGPPIYAPVIVGATTG